MIFQNAKIFNGAGFSEGSFEVENGRFTAVCDHAGQDKSAVDLGGAYVIPGLVDIHIHGSAGADASDADVDGLLHMGRYLAAKGVTSFVPTTMTLPLANLERAFGSVKSALSKRSADCARILGIHMEGPFLSEKKRGAQNKVFLKNPDYAAFEQLYQNCEGLIKIVDVAPELESAAAFAQKVSSLCTVSVAHSDADYLQACEAFDMGASHLTHLYNAMPPIHHRKPGVIGAASDREFVTAELICDGCHVHPSAVRMAFKLFPGRICLVSDALRCAGMPDGEYELGGQIVCLSGNVARLKDGTIAGSASCLSHCLRNAISFGIPVADAVRAATIVPAKVIGCEDKIGSITAGKHADFLVCDDTLRIREVYLGGTLIN